MQNLLRRNGYDNDDSDDDNDDDDVETRIKSHFCLAEWIQERKLQLFVDTQVHKTC